MPFICYCYDPQTKFLVKEIYGNTLNDIVKIVKEEDIEMFQVYELINGLVQETVVFSERDVEPAPER